MKKSSWQAARFRRATATAVVLALASVAAAACSESTGPGAVTGVEIVVLPVGTATTNLVRGTTLQLLAAPHDANDQFVDVAVTWSSSDPAKAAVGADGTVTIGTGAAAGGDVTITATGGGMAGTFALNVQHPVATVTVTPATSTIRQEGTVDLTAGLVDAVGAAATGRTVAWTSSNTAFATVNSSGVVSGVADGTVTITATAQNGDVANVAGTATVTVSGAPLVATVVVTPASPFRAIGQTIQFSHSSRAASGTTISGTTAAWSSSSTSIMTIDPVTGLATVVGNGTAQARATVDNGIGTNVVGNTTLRGATPLVNGVTENVPTTTAGDSYWYGFVVPAGVTTFTIVSSGGTGDGDIFVYTPTGTLVGFSFNSGNSELVTINNVVAGTYRIEMNAWSGAPPNTAGMTITLTHP